MLRGNRGEYENIICVISRSRHSRADISRRPQTSRLPHFSPTSLCVYSFVSLPPSLHAITISLSLSLSQFFFHSRQTSIRRALKHHSFDGDDRAALVLKDHSIRVSNLLLSVFISAAGGRACVRVHRTDGCMPHTQTLHLQVSPHKSIG